MNWFFIWERCQLDESNKRIQEWFKDGKGRKKSQRLEQYIEKVEGSWNQQLKSLEICYNFEEDAQNEIKLQYLTGPQKIWVDYLHVWFLLFLRFFKIYL